VKKIQGFFNNYRFLSNFYPSPIVYEGIVYPTVEHAYQAAKTSERLLKQRIASMATPAEAKRAGKTLYRVGWHNVSLQIMKDLVRLKFTINSDLKYMLLMTNDAYLEETKQWHDTFWGVCEGVGENHLGKILMKIRKELNEKNRKD
jgi:hypothetical protein